MERRVVVTGMGVVSCAGNSVPAFWESLSAGRSGIGPRTLFEAADLPSAVGEVRNFDLPDLSPALIRASPAAPTAKRVQRAIRRDSFGLRSGR